MRPKKTITKSGPAGVEHGENRVSDNVVFFWIWFFFWSHLSSYSSYWFLLVLGLLVNCFH